MDILAASMIIRKNNYNQHTEHLCGRKSYWLLENSMKAMTAGQAGKGVAEIPCV